MKKQSLLSGALVLSLALFICKALGALYRIPLTNILGVEGIGIYQLVFPIFCFFLVLSTGGIPVAESLLISKSTKAREKKKIFSYALISMTVVGLFFAIIMICMSKNFSVMVGTEKTLWGFMCLSPAVLICSVTGAIKGYFQGEKNMIPTSVSQIVQSMFKLIFGITLSWFFSQKSMELAIVGAFLGITISEIFSLTAVLIFYFFDKNREKTQKNDEKSQNVTTFGFAKMSVLLTLTSVAMPLLGVLDSFFAVNFLVHSGYDSMVATSLFGILSGIVAPLVSIPSIFASGLATAIIPNLSGEIKSDKISICLKYILLVAVPFALALVFFSKEILLLIFPKIMQNPETLNIAKNLLAIGSINVISLSLLTVCISILQSKEKLVLPNVIMLCAIVSKIILSVCFVVLAEKGIIGYYYASTLSFFLAASLSYIYLPKHNANSPWLIKLIFCNQLLCFVFAVFKMVEFSSPTFAVFAMCCILLYFAMLKYVRLFNLNDFKKQ